VLHVLYRVGVRVIVRISNYVCVLYPWIVQHALSAT